jgi:hypothetical protein
MNNFKTFFLVPLLGFATASCSTLPELPADTGLHSSEIINRVKCELQQALAAHPEHHSWLLKWAAGFSLTMKVKERAGASASSDYIWPITLGTFRFSLGGALSEDATRIAQFKLSLPLADAVDFPCPDGPATAPSDRTLTGNIGLADWMKESITAVASSKSEDQFNGMGHTLEFFLAANASAGPSWAIIRSNGHRANPAFGLSAQREATNTLEVALVKIPSGAPQRVFVTNWPAGFQTPPATTPPSAAPQPQGAAPKARALRAAPAPRGVDPETQRRLDNILQDLQFRNLQLDR